MKAILRFLYIPKVQNTHIHPKKKKKNEASTVSCVLSLFLYLEQNVHKIIKYEFKQKMTNK